MKIHIDAIYKYNMLKLFLKDKFKQVISTLFIDIYIYSIILKYTQNKQIN